MNETNITQPVTSPNMTAPRLEFQKKRFLERHFGLMKSLHKQMDEVYRHVERIENNDVQNVDYSSLTETLMSFAWLAREAHALDYTSNVFKAVEGRK